MELCNAEESYELNKIIDTVDSRVSHITRSSSSYYIAHLVPWLFSLTFATGMTVFAYKIIM